MSDYAWRALACLDLTSLNLDDTEERIDALCDRALQPGGGVAEHPAAVCVYPRFAAQCRARLDGHDIAVAVVVNFPGGDGAEADVLAEVDGALAAGADEIDVVFPYAAYLDGRREEAVHLVRAVSHRCHEREEPAVLKVILETGVLAEREAIVAAALDAVEAGADFLKTSTGKREPGATPEAVAALLEVVVDVEQSTGRRVGVKVSGGVRTVADAAAYLGMADDVLGAEEVEPTRFRFGASGLLDDIVRVLSAPPGSSDPSPTSPPSSNPSTGDPAGY